MTNKITKTLLGTCPHAHACKLAVSYLKKQACCGCLAALEVLPNYPFYRVITLMSVFIVRIVTLKQTHLFPICRPLRARL